MKWKLVAGCIVLAVVVYFLPIPVTRTGSIVVHAPYDKVLGQVNNLNAWKNWWPGPADGITVVGDTILQTPGATYTLKEKQPLSMVVAQNHQPVYHVLSVIPSGTDTSTIVTWKTLTYLRTAINQMAAALFTHSPYSTKSLLQSLKSHMEDPLKYYGFDIRIEPIDDTIILVAHTACTRETIPECLRKTFTLLQLQLQDAGYQGKAVPMFHIDSTGADSIQVMAGLSITKQITANKPFRIMSMPKVHIVVGYFTGDYKNIGRLHDAMTFYTKNNKMARAAVPYEKVLSNPQTASDSQHVTVKVYHPSMIL